MAALVENYRVIRYDLRGLGQSAAPTAPYRMCDDVAAVLDHLGVDAAAVVGFSTGGAVAVDFTVRYPARATALVTIGAITEREPTQIPGFDAARRDLARQLAERDAAAARGDVDAAVAVDLDVWATAHHGAARAELEEWAKANPYFHFSTSEHDEYEQINPVSDAVLATITAPALITVGELDVGLSRLCADHLAATIPGARLRVFAGADHFVSTAERAEFNATLRTFLGRAARSPAR
jgi:pimeloyl-ACP methyl ester carboxylesterase